MRVGLIIIIRTSSLSLNGDVISRCTQTGFIPFLATSRCGPPSTPKSLQAPSFTKPPYVPLLRPYLLPSSSLQPYSPPHNYVLAQSLQTYNGSKGSTAAPLPPHLCSHQGEQTGGAHIPGQPSLVQKNSVDNQRGKNILYLPSSVVILIPLCIFLTQKRKGF